MDKLKVLELFSGVGAFTKALTNLNIDYELVGFSDIDKYAIESYSAIHKIDKSLNLGDISKVSIEDVPDCDLMTYSFPCQDISVAGKQNGYSEDSGTRSSLLWEAVKIAKYKKPKYLIAENVKNLIGKKFKDDFNKWLEQLDKLGYNTYYKVLNSKDFRIPQNRERVFVVSIRKDIDKGKFEFPEGSKIPVKLRDILEKSVDDKYYLSDEVQKRFKFNEKYNENIIGSTAPEFRTIGQSDTVYKTEGVVGTLLARDYKQPKQIIEVVGNLDIKGMDCIKRVYSTEGVSPTLTTMEVGKTGLYMDTEEMILNGAIRGRYDDNNKIHQRLEIQSENIANTLTTVQKDNVVIEPKLLIKNATKKGYLEAVDGDGIDLAYPDSNTRRGRVQPQRSHTITTSDNLGDLQGYKIRKLTPLECWRLMGFDDEDFKNAKQALNNTYYKGKDKSDSQLYKQAGNSIVVDVLESILHNLFK